MLSYTCLDCSDKFSRPILGQLERQRICAVDGQRLMPGQGQCLQESIEEDNILGYLRYIQCHTRWIRGVLFSCTLRQGHWWHRKVFLYAPSVFGHSWRHPHICASFSMY